MSRAITLISILVFVACQCEEGTVTTITRGIKIEAVNKNLPTKFETASKDIFNLDFGIRTINKTYEEQIKVTNESQIEIVVKSIQITDSADGVYSIKEDIPSKIDANQSFIFTVLYTPKKDRSNDIGKLKIITENTTIPDATINLIGNGTTSEATILIISPEGKDLTCDDKGIQMTFYFGPQRINTSKTLTATVKNKGPSILNVTMSPVLGPAFKIEKPTSSTFSLKPYSESQEITVRFTPTSTDVYSGKIILNTNDSNCKTANELYLTGRGTSGGIEVCGESEDCPNELRMCQCTLENTTTITMDFGDVKKGEKKDLKLRIKNLGDSNLNINEVKFTDQSSEFSYSPQIPPKVSLKPNGDPNGEDTKILTITYAPSTNNKSSNSLIIKSDDTSKPVITIKLNGESNPKLSVSPDGMLIFKTAPSKTESLPFTIANAGYAPLTVSKIQIDQNTGVPTAFKILNFNAEKTLQPGEFFSVNVEFTNNPNIANESAQIFIYSNDPYWSSLENPYYILMLYSDDSSSDMPPIAVAKAPGGDLQKVRSSERPLKVLLDGSASYDDNAITQYKWSIIFKPRNSQAQIDDPSAQKTFFNADEYGKYTIQLIVVDNVGQESTPSTISITVVEDI
ncbi:MAG: choice-of-anchor D domain-containing protein [Deltaproteobacteria bacterium]|nr:choice-of-anchor D domain-containing protein [Deltaproteobacteria bacterium]